MTHSLPLLVGHQWPTITLNKLLSFVLVKVLVTSGGPSVAHLPPLFAGFMSFLHYFLTKHDVSLL